MVKADVPTGKKAGLYCGRVAVRASGSFNIQAGLDVIQGISHKHCRIAQRSDDYGHSNVLTTLGKNDANRSCTEDMKVSLTAVNIQAYCAIHS
jgi:hypothetical protein